VAYVGGLTVERGAVEMVEAIAKVTRFPDARLVLAGDISPKPLVETLTGAPGWQRVDYRGHLDRAGVRSLLAQARAGLVLLHPLQSYVESQPIKLFEYMAAGLPVIAADFPRFREIIEGNSCGICVPPRDTAAIAKAIEWILEHPEPARAMGRKGRELVQRLYNWEHEAETLLRLYDRLLARAPTGGCDAAESPDRAAPK
jgi:glycosyltransferase involved in cell wall biosynthesis